MYNKNMIHQSFIGAFFPQDALRLILHPFCLNRDFKIYSFDVGQENEIALTSGVDIRVERREI